MNIFLGVPAISIDPEISMTTKGYGVLQGRLKNDVLSVVKAGIPENTYTTRIRSGDLVAHQEDSSGVYYAPDAGTLTVKNMIGENTLPCKNPKNPQGLLLCGIFIPNDISRPASIFSIFQKDSKDEVPSTSIKKTTREAWTENSFKRELIYGGLSQKTISISYREFSDGTARPAFTQDLKYDLSEGDIIGFRGARFKVIQATNTTLRYKLLKPLD